VIVGYFNFIRPKGGPDKANPVLLVYAYAVLAFSVSSESFKSIAWRDFQLG